MALSNWDTLAVDLQGKATNGIFVSPAGVRVEIYKNWVYVYDEKAWREHATFTSPCIMEIQSGDIRYMDVEIKAIRGPQGGVYVACWHVTYSDDNKATYDGMVGCGVYGFEGERWIGVTQSSKEFLQTWLSATHQVFSEEEIQHLLDQMVDAESSRRAEVETSLREPSFDFPDEIAQVKLGEALRFNQGDAFFARKLGFEIPATETGEPNSPIISGVLKNMSEETPKEEKDGE